MMFVRQVKWLVIDAGMNSAKVCSRIVRVCIFSVSYKVTRVISFRLLAIISRSISVSEQ